MRNWERPMAVVDAFVANEFVSACGDTNKVYKFKCTADAGTLYYYPQGDGTIDGIYTGSGEAKRIGNYTPCKAEHDASTTDDFMMDMFIHPHTKGYGRLGITQKKERLLLYGVARTEEMVMQPQI